MLNIKPITLLEGPHVDTHITGSGCFMNVAAYLNGDKVISDESPCVSRLIREVAIYVNDNYEDEDRQKTYPPDPSCYADRQCFCRRIRKVC